MFWFLQTDFITQENSQGKMFLFPTNNAAWMGQQWLRVRLFNGKSTCDDGSVQVCLQKLLLHNLWIPGRKHGDNHQEQQEVGHLGAPPPGGLTYTVGLSPPHRSTTYCLHSWCSGKKSSYLEIQTEPWQGEFRKKSTSLSPTHTHISHHPN